MNDVGMEIGWLGEAWLAGDLGRPRPTLNAYITPRIQSLGAFGETIAWLYASRLIYILNPSASHIQHSTTTP